MMNNKMLAGISVAALGTGTFILGTVLGISFASKHCRKCQELRYEYEEKCEDISEDESENLPGEEIEDVQAKMYKDYISHVYKYQSSSDDIDKANNRPRHNNRFPWGESEKVEETPEFLRTDPIQGNKENPDIEIITVEAFLNDCEGLSQTTLVYFEEDGIMIDNRDEAIPMQEYESCLGVDKEGLEGIFGLLSDDEDVVYIRNRTLNYEYEVIREHSSYAKSVLGIGPSEEEYEAAREFFNLDDGSGGEPMNDGTEEQE